METMRTRQRTVQLSPPGKPSDRTGLSDILSEVDPLLENQEPLDVQEQQKLIELFEDAQLREARTWKVGAVVQGLAPRTAGAAARAPNIRLAE